MSESAPSSNYVGPASPSPASLAESRDDATPNASGGAGSSTSQPSLPKPGRLSEKDFACIPPETCKLLRAQDNYITCLEERLSCLEGELASVKEGEEKLRAQHAESQQREKVLVRRLAAKEQEMQDVAAQMAELKSNQTATPSGLRSALLDPAVNILLQRLRHELLTSRTRLDETQNELSAWKFTPDSNTGKRLMAKCRLLYTENEELGKLTNSGRVAKLEGELALQKKFSEEVKKSQSELDEFLQDLDEDVEGMQSTIYYLQQELRKTKDIVVSLERELNALRNTSETNSIQTVVVSNKSSDIEQTKINSSNNNNNNNNTVQQTAHAQQQQQQQQIQHQQKLNGNCNNKSDCDRTRVDSDDSEPELTIKLSEKEVISGEEEEEDSRDGVLVIRSAADELGGDCARSDSVGMVNGDAKRTYDSDSSETNNRVSKKVRRSSVLSLEYNEDNMDDDTLVISTNGDGAMSDAD